MLLPLSEVSNFETLLDKWQQPLCKIYLYLTSSMKEDDSLSTKNRFMWWKRGGKVITNFCSTNKLCGFTGSRSSSLQRNPTNSIMRWCCSSIEYAVSTFHTEFMSFFLFLNSTKFSSCFILAKFSPFQAALDNHNLIITLGEFAIVFFSSGKRNSITFLF